MKNVLIGESSGETSKVAITQHYFQEAEVDLLEVA